MWLKDRYMCILHSLPHRYAHIFLFVVCLHVSAYKWFLHVASNVRFTWLRSCCLLGHCHIWSLSVLFDVLHLNVSYLQLTQKISADSDYCCHPHSLAVVLLLNTTCVIHHMLSGAVKSSHDKYCFSVYETIMLASHFKQPLSSAVDCTALAKSVLWAHSVIIQRQEDVSFAKSMKYNIFHY